MAMARDGMLPEAVLRRRPSRGSRRLEIDDPGRSGRRTGRRARPAGIPGRPGHDRYPVRVRGRLRRGVDPPVTSPEIERPFRAPALYFVAPASIMVNAALMWFARPRQLDSPLRLARSWDW